MSATHPFALTSATRLDPAHFRPQSQSQSRSRSRSPIRKSQFVARELDPLLKNLSPTSTLKALQATATIRNDDGNQDALARSIAEASPAEREIGIRAAVAAQKLKEWHQEIAKWSWPVRRDRGWGAGFLPPPKNSTSTSSNQDVSYLGFLPALRVAEYQDRIEDIRDGIEALELEEVKDHIFSAHAPLRPVAVSHSLGTVPETRSTGYGRMRDFTALVTATVIQALPELANLNMLLDAWDVRLAVLRSIPDISHTFRSTRAGISTAFEVVRDAETGPLVTMEEYQDTKKILGGKVASLGAKIDKLLDLLEGQEDSLPKSWIDALENIESEYAAWVVEGEHVTIRNGLLSKALTERKDMANEANVNPNGTANITDGTSVNSAVQIPPVKDVNDDDRTPTLQLPAFINPENDSGTLSTRQVPHEVNAPERLPPTASLPVSKHNRGVSEVSVADSMFSTVSGISTAEIVDAKSTHVLSSPKISVVENPLRGNRDELPWLTPPNQKFMSNSRPPMIQRASTASIEVVSKDSVRQVTLTRSRSHDMLSRFASLSGRPGTTPSQALEHLSGNRSSYIAPTEEIEPALRFLSTGESSAAIDAPSSTVSPSPSLRVEPLMIRSRSQGIDDIELPSLPRRSSKRLSGIFPTDPHKAALDDTAESADESPVTVPQHSAAAKQAPIRTTETLEDKIQTILSTMPTKIRLADEKDANDTLQDFSASSTRSSTPAPSLTLSPVRADRASRLAVSGDVRVFHLTKSGQSRDTPPVKLFVRAVGEHGERVMVRVGGGWADLAEYLREYSLHHGHRGLINSTLEVANFPNTQPAQKDFTTSPIPSANSSPGHVATKRRSFPDTLSGSNDLSSLAVGKVRKNGRGNVPDATSPALSDRWTPPPVPPIPRAYTVQMPTTIVTTTDGVTNMSTIAPPDTSPYNAPRAVSSPINMSNNTDDQPFSNSVATSSPSNGGAKYIPLGAAGPMSNGRRAISHTLSSNTVRESWVEGMVDKARAVSGGTTVYQGPTTTTSTTVISRSIPTNRRVSAMPNLSPAGSPSIISPSSSTSKVSPVSTRPKNRMSLGDVSGIRRVFLRKKSDN